MRSHRGTLATPLSALGPRVQSRKPLSLSEAAHSEVPCSGSTWASESAVIYLFFCSHLFFQRISVFRWVWARWGRQGRMEKCGRGALKHVGFFPPQSRLVRVFRCLMQPCNCVVLIFDAVFVSSSTVVRFCLFSSYNKPTPMNEWMTVWREGFSFFFPPSISSTMSRLCVSKGFFFLFSFFMLFHFLD